MKPIDSTFQLHVRGRVFDKILGPGIDLLENYPKNWRTALIQDTGWIPAKSFVQWFLYLHHIRFESVARSATDTGGVSRYVIPSRSYCSLNSAAADSTYGVVIGTGVTAPATADHKITTQIANGAGGGQLYYGSTGFLWGVIGANVDEIINRIFTNESGATINSKEVGIYGRTATDGYYFCFTHDLLNLAILDDSSACIEYRMRTTV